MLFFLSNGSKKYSWLKIATFKMALKTRKMDKKKLNFYLQVKF